MIARGPDIGLFRPTPFDWFFQSRVFSTWLESFPHESSTFARTSSVVIFLSLSVRNFRHQTFSCAGTPRASRQEPFSALHSGIEVLRIYIQQYWADNDFISISAVQSLNYIVNMLNGATRWFVSSVIQCLNYSHPYCILHVPTSLTSTSWMKEQTGINDGILILDTEKWDPSPNAFNASCQAAATLQQYAALQGPTYGVLERNWYVCLIIVRSCYHSSSL